MAAILQLRRGTSNASPVLTEGELYLHQGSGSVQFGSGSATYNLLPLNAPVKGDIDLQGNISASGDVRIGGNIYLGNATADNIQALGQFTTNLVPNGTIDIGTTSAPWTNIYSTNVYGNIKAYNGVVSGSSQIIASLPTGLVSGSSQVNFTQLSGISNNIVSASTDSNNIDFTITNGNITANLFGGVVSGSSQIASVLTSLNQFSSSINTATASLNLTTASLNTFTASNGNTSLNSYTASLKTAITVVSTDVTIAGNLTVNGTTTQINSTQVNIGDNIIELNYGGSQTTSGIITKDATGGSVVSGSLLWDASTDFWKAGKLGSEAKILTDSMGVVSGSDQIASVLTSLNTYTSSQDVKNGTLSNVTASFNTATASLNTFSASVLGHISDINTKTGSFENKFTTLQTYTSSIDSKFTIIQGVTASYNTATASLNTFSSSINGHVADINSWTSSINNKFTTLQSVTASLNAATASLIISASQLTASFTQLRSDFATLQTSVDPNSISGHLANINAWTSSINGHVVDINLKTGSFETKFSTLQTLTASMAAQVARIQESTASLNAYTQSNDTTNTTQNIRLSRIEESTSSLNTFTGSLAVTYEGRATATKTIFSGSSQVSYLGLSNIPSGIISSSAQIDTLFNIDGIVSGSSQINYTQLSGISANIISASSNTTSIIHTISGGSISAYVVGGIVSGSSQITPLLPTGVVSGSIQVLGSSTVLSGSNQTYVSTINQSLGTTSTGVQFATLGIGTAPDATYELKVAGDIAASGDIVAYNTSDERLKNNIQPIENALDKINKLGGYTFEWNEELQKARSGNDIGVIAQEVDSVFPQIVARRDNGFLAVDYEKLVPVLIEAIKELSAKVTELENK